MGDHYNQEYNAIDLAKFICAIFVVAIHVAPFGSNGSSICMLFNYAIQQWLARAAVPFFFVASGFFFRKFGFKESSMETSKNYIIRLVKLYIIWTIIYFPLHVKSILFSEEGLFHELMIYVRNFIFAGSHGQLWYFPALIFSVVVLSFLLSRRINTKYIIIISMLLYVIGLLDQSWFGIIEPIRIYVPSFWNILKLIENIIVTTRNGLFEGLLFVTIGVVIADHGFNISRKKALLGFVLSYIAMLIEVAFVTYFHLIKGYDMYICLVPLSYFMFGLIVNYRIPSDSDVFKLLRILSSLIFYIHLWIKWGLMKIFDFIGFDVEKTCLLFILTAIGSIVCSYVIIKLSNVKHFTWMRKIYE